MMPPRKAIPQRGGAHVRVVGGRDAPGDHLSSAAVVMMRQRRPAVLAARPGRLGDAALMGVGLAAAIGSATFAGYMITSDNSNPQFVGADHLMIFAQPIRSTPVAPVRVAGPVPAGPGVDFTPTGSIDRAPTDGRPASDVASRIVGYTLREARNGVAIVDGARGSFEIITGATLPGAGRVISIERRAGKWQVLTEAGIIGAAQ